MDFSLNDLVVQAHQFAQEPPPLEVPPGLKEQPITALIDHTLLKPEATLSRLSNCVRKRGAMGLLPFV